MTEISVGAQGDANRFTAVDVASDPSYFSNQGMGEQNRKHAIVIGGSMGGLVAARVLSDHFDQVTLIDRDVFPEVGRQRRGVPQGPRNAGVSFINWYIAKLHKAAHRDPEASVAFLKVANLLAPLPSIMHPRLAMRVLLANLRA